ncbi:MAG: replicative DNA helicase [Lachnospiraceae bacterium]|nr:replicative DNA helicase [Lachnospiraceae bacterium]
MDDTRIESGDNSAPIRQMPSSREAEQSVVGSMLMDPQTINTATEALTEDDFFYPQYKAIFSAIIEVYNRTGGADPVEVINTLQKNGVPQEFAEASFLGDLMQNVPLATNIRSYCRIVKEKSILRNIIRFNQSVEKDCLDGNKSVDEIMDETEKGFLALLQNRGVSDYVPISRIVVDAIKSIENASKHEGNVTGIPTGFIDLDYMLAGLQNSDLILIAARPSMGKTAFALNVAQHVALKEHKTVALFSLEMSKEQYVKRLFSLESTVDSQKLRTGQLTDTEWGQLFEAGSEIGKSNLIVDDTPSITISELRSKCRKYKQEQNLALVFIDYLQLMSNGHKTESRQQEISEISRALKALARELDIPVVALSQLNRSVEQRDDKRPILSDLRDSGAIEQDADVVMFIYRDDYYNKDTDKKNVSEIIIAKQRNGPVGTVELAWLPNLTRFANKTHSRKKDNFD